MVNFKFDGPVENGYKKTSANGSWLCGIQYVPTPAVSPSEFMDHESLLAPVSHIMSPIFISMKHVCNNIERSLKRTLKSSYSVFKVPGLW